MAAVLTQTKPALHFPHSLLHDNSRDFRSYPKMEKNIPAKLSLPPISSLMKDIDRKLENGPATPPLSETQRRISSDSQMANSRSPERLSIAGSPRNGLPPTPPLPGTSSFDFVGRHCSVGASPKVNGGGQNGYFGASPTSSNPELYTQHRPSYPPLPDTARWSASSSPTTARRASDETLSLRRKVENNVHRSSYPDLVESLSSTSGLAQQRPLPANFPGPIHPSSPGLPAIDLQMATSQQQQQQQQQHHHHSYSIPTSPGFSPTTDRYQCPTCQKAFSRPSSLKIHTYSHTGEKPFKCKYDGCGKYFSVRSNMKRHEKGCHGADTSSAGGNSPKAM